MIDAVTVFVLIWMHFFSDFILQSDRVSVTKGKNIFALFKHVLVYTTPFLLIDIKFAIVTGCLHFLVDFTTSRITTKLLDKKTPWFFATIGADQATHLTLLMGTAIIML